MEAEVDEVVGPKGRHDEGRAAVRHGREDGSMTLGARRVAACRPRVRSADGEHEIPLASYEHFADRDPLTRGVMDRMLAGVSSRRFASVAEPVGSEVEDGASSTSRSAVSRAFVERTRTALGELMSRGSKTFASTVARPFARAAIATRSETSPSTCPSAIARRCARGCERPGRLATPSSPARAWSWSPPSSTRAGPTPGARFARGWRRPYIEIVRHTQRNVKSWQSGDMRLRGSATGMLEAEKQFRRIIGYRDLAALALAVEHEVAAAAATSTTEEVVAEPTTV